MPSRMFVVFGAIISAVARAVELLATENVEWNPKGVQALLPGYTIVRRNSQLSCACDSCCRTQAAQARYLSLSENYVCE